MAQINPCCGSLLVRDGKTYCDDPFCEDESHISSMDPLFPDLMTNNPLFDEMNAHMLKAAEYALELGVPPLNFYIVADEAYAIVRAQQEPA